MAGAGCSVPVRQHGHMHQNGGSPGPPGPFLLILTTSRGAQGPATLNLQFLLVVPARCCHCATSHQSSSAKASTVLGSVLNFVFSWVVGPALSALQCLVPTVLPGQRRGLQKQKGWRGGNTSLAFAICAEGLAARAEAEICGGEIAAQLA